MNGRTLASLVASWLGLYWFVRTEQITMLEGIVIGVISAVLGVFLWELGRHICSAYSKKHMFAVCFVDHQPPYERAVDKWNPHPIPFGRSKHYLKVTCKKGLKLIKFNVRFIDLLELVSGPDDQPIDIRSIIQIREVHFSPEVPLQGISYRETSDEKGGIDVVLDRPLILGGREPFVLTIELEVANQPWSGKISFRCLDNEQVRRFARNDVRIDSDVLPPEIFVSKFPVASAVYAIDISKKNNPDGS